MAPGSMCVKPEINHVSLAFWGFPTRPRNPHQPLACPSDLVEVGRKCFRYTVSVPAAH